MDRQGQIRIDDLFLLGSFKHSLHSIFVCWLCTRNTGNWESVNCQKSLPSWSLFQGRRSYKNKWKRHMNKIWSRLTSDEYVKTEMGWRVCKDRNGDGKGCSGDDIWIETHRQYGNESAFSMGNFRMKEESVLRVSGGTLLVMLQTQ
jgi:hypothetical protein